MFCGYTVETISHCITESFLKKHHYLAQQGSGFLGKVQYGLFDKQLHLVGVIAFSGFSVWQTLIGAFEGFERYSNQDGFWELTRLAMDDERKEKNLTSWFVARAIRKLRKSYNVRAILSYADSTYHHGYIYQATNFGYYGLTDPKCDFHERQEDGTLKLVWRGAVKGHDGEWIERSRKHRYLLVFDKSLKVKWQKQPYPKGDNEEYELKEQDKTQLSIFDVI